MIHYKGLSETKIPLEYKCWKQQILTEENASGEIDKDGENG